MSDRPFESRPRDLRPDGVELDDHGDEQMRRSRRLLLVALTTLVLLAIVWIMVRPALGAWWVIGGVPALLVIPWIVLLVMLTAQVSSRVRPGLLALGALILLVVPGVVAMAIGAAYTQLAMEQTTGVVVRTFEKDSGGPIPIEVRLPDGSVEKGYSNYGRMRAGYRDVVVPDPGAELAVMRDPNGWLPLRVAGASDHTSRGNMLAAAWSSAGLAGLGLYAVWCWSALTRRRSVLNAAGADDW